MLKRMVLLGICLTMMLALAGCVMQSKYDALLAQNGEQKGKIDQLGNQVDQARLDATSLKAQLKAEQEALELAKRGGGDKDAQIAILTKRIADLQDKLKGLDAMPAPPSPGVGDPRPAPVRVNLPASVSKALEDLAGQERIFEFSPATGRCTFTSEVLFDEGDATVTPQFERVLAKFAGIFTAGAGQGLFLRIEGHTDNQAITDSRTKAKHPTNWHLSAHRAIEVMRTIFKAGVDEDRMMVVGYGSQHPGTDNSTASGRARNRRVEIWVLPAQRTASRG